MKVLLLWVIVLFISTIPASNPAARIWNINSAGTGDAATIQAGIDSATTGDTVLLADGTYTGFYNRNIDFKGKAITVRSASGNPNACIIDPQGNNRGFYFHTGESATSVLEYVKITNGNTGSSGGGIACYIASPTITGCIVSSCFANGGGGMYCEEASPMKDTWATKEHPFITTNGYRLYQKHPIYTANSIVGVIFCCPLWKKVS